MTKEEYQEFVLRYKGCGACFPNYYTLSQEEKLWFSAIQKDVTDLENQNKLLGKRCNQLLKDKGELTDQIADIKANCDLAIEGRDIKIKELEQQIEKMKRHCNCKHRDSEGYCEVKRTYLMDLSYDGCDKWELED